MTKQQHPITPPPDLVEQWHSNSPLDRGLTLATQAAQWGADQELDACCNEVQYMYSGGNRLRDARRPKPPSLKEQALEALRQVGNCEEIDNVTFETIRRALKQLDD
jgi:hypothetical protein